MSAIAETLKLSLDKLFAHSENTKEKRTKSCALISDEMNNINYMAKAELLKSGLSEDEKAIVVLIKETMDAAMLDYIFGKYGAVIKSKETGGDSDIEFVTYEFNANGNSVKANVAVEYLARGALVVHSSKNTINLNGEKIEELLASEIGCDFTSMIADKIAFTNIMSDEDVKKEELVLMEYEKLEKVLLELE